MLSSSLLNFLFMTCYLINNHYHDTYTYINSYRKYWYVQRKKSYKHIQVLPL